MPAATTTHATHPAGALLTAMRDIKLAHTVFAMPFAILAGALAFPPDTPAARVAGIMILIVLCMVLARTWAMLVNRLADARFDKDNPRTARRAIAEGRLSPRQGWRIALASAAGFVLAASLFIPVSGNAWPAILALPVLGFVALYSYMKRFTALCHLFLGAALAISPIAAAIAVRPEALGDTPALWWLAGFVMLWVAGFDVIYALQDLDFDRATGLNSIPAKLGWRGANWVSRLFHLAALGCLFQVNQVERALGAGFSLAVLAVAALLVAEHALLIRRGAAGIPVAFFTLNGIASLTLGVAGLADILIRYA
ncbi:MAG: 4-hydroxybenzoate octaprenyltransferase [Phycisphaerales bacterium]